MENDRINLLIVDDEERFLQTTKKLLEKKGIHTLTATSGTAGFSVLESEPVDVVVLDVKMPGMSGMGVLKKIKKEFPSVEVIMLTGHATVQSAVGGIKYGAFDYLMKPCDVDVLASKVRDAFEKKQSGSGQVEQSIR
jgi:DNA-binding NtrC family response regulator